MDERTHPIEGQIVLVAGARASVTLTRLSGLVERAQRHVRGNRDEYDRQFERIEGPQDLVYYLADQDHWETVGEELGLDDRETDAVRRAHAEQFRRTGRRLDRLDEFETTMEIRDVVVMSQQS
jgi:hypothetical protein